MMQVKKFRAATTRAALEQIKQELGEDAFVLETKRVQTRSFLGLKSESQIEISAAPAPVAKNDGERAKKSTLSLKDESVAAPLPAEAEEVENAVALPKFLMALQKDSANEAKKSRPHAAKIEPVEISSEAPRIVHAKKEPLPQKKTKEVETEAVMEKTLVAEETAPAINPAAPVVTSRDLELLRAEMREMKFSLGAFAARQNVHFSHGIIDLEAHGEIYDSPFYESFIELTATGIAPEVARRLVQNIIPDYKSGSVKASEIARTALLRGLSAQVKFDADPLKKDSPAILAVIGSTGVGKTTTIAKLAARVALHENRRVELITLDTYRIAAVEQLKTYAEIIGANCHVVRSTLELDACLRRLPEDATVLIDTTGRSPHDLADQYELCDYLQRRAEIRKCLALQATTNALDAIAAIRKFQMYGADCLAITKMDETTRPGAMLELAAEGALPLVYFGTGQRVPEDIQVATQETFANRILGEKSIMTMSAANRN